MRSSLRSLNLFVQLSVVILIVSLSGQHLVNDLRSAPHSLGHLAAAVPDVNWQVQALSPAIIDVNCSDENNCFAVTKLGEVWEGTKAGINWTSNWNLLTAIKNLYGTTTVTVNAISCVDASSGTPYCMVATTVGEFVTINGGESWTYSQNSSAETDVSCGSTTFCVAVDDNDNVITSINDSDNDGDFGTDTDSDSDGWVSYATIYGSDIFSSVSCVDSINCVVVGTGGISGNGQYTGALIYTTSDSGTSWFHSASASLPGYVYDGSISGVSCAELVPPGTQVLTIECMLSDELVEYPQPTITTTLMTDDNSVWTDSGYSTSVSNSSQVACGTNGSDFNCIAFGYHDGTDTISLWSYADGFWMEETSHLPPAVIQSEFTNTWRGSCTSDTFCLASVDNGGLIGSTDGGVHWGELLYSASSPNSVSCSTATTCFGLANNGQISHTTTAGEVWDVSPTEPAYGTQSEIPGNTKLNSISCPTPDVCYVVGSNGVIMKTTNGGQVMGSGNSKSPGWQVTELISTLDFDVISCADATDCIAVSNGSNGLTIYSTKNGMTWENDGVLQSSGGVSPLSISCPTTTWCDLITNNTSWYMNGSPANWITNTPSDILGETITAISCPSAKNCVITGESASNGYLNQGWAIAMSSGTFGSVTNITTSSPNENLATTSSISCPTTSWCEGFGTTYYLSNTLVSAFQLSLQGDVITANYIDNLPTSSGNYPTYGNSISCPSVGICFGSVFEDSTHEGSNSAFISTNGVLPLPSDAFDPAEFYHLPNPLEKCLWCQLNSLGASAAADSGDPVNDLNGDYSESSTDVSVPAAGTPLSFSKSFDNEEANNSSSYFALGYGMADNWGSNLTTDSSGNLTETTTTGSQVVFYKQVNGACPSDTEGYPTQLDGSYCADPRVDSTLTAITENGYSFDKLVVNGLTTYLYCDPSELSTCTLPNSETIPKGALATITDEKGAITTLLYCTSPTCTYDSNSYANGELEEVLDTSTNNYLLFSYNSLGLITEVDGYTLFQKIDSASYSYDTNNDLIETSISHNGITGSQDTVYSYSATNPTSCPVDAYSSNPPPSADIHDLISITDPMGNVTYNCYDSQGRVFGQINPAGGITTWDYEGNPMATGGYTTVTSPNGNSTEFDYSGGVLVGTTTGSGSSNPDTTSFGRDLSLDYNTYLATSLVNANGTSSLSYDADGNVMTTTDAVGNTTETAYTTNNLEYCSITPSNYTYLLANNKATCPTSPPSAPPLPGATDPYLYMTITFYNADNLPYATTDALGNTTETSYTLDDGVPDNLPYCSLSATAYAEGVTCSSYGVWLPGTTDEVYDSEGRVMISWNSTGAPTTYTYSNAFPDKVASQTSPDGTVTNYIYNYLGEVTSTAITYQPSGWTTAYTATTLDAYDSDGRLYCQVAPLEVSNGINCPATEPAYGTAIAGATMDYFDANGNLTETINPTGGVTENTYDSDGREFCTVSPRNYATGVRCLLSPPLTPPLPGSLDSYLGMEITTYDANGNTVQTTSPTGAVTETTYDPAGNAVATKSMTSLPVDHITIPVDAGSLDSMSCPSSSLCVTGDNYGNVMTTTDPTGTSNFWTSANIDSTNQITSVTCPTTTFCVAVDNQGNVMTSTNPTGGATAWTSANIDSTNQITSVTCPTTTFCVAVDDKGNYLYFNGTTWSAPASIDLGNSLNSVTCPTTTFCVAVDNQGNVMTSTNPTGGATAWTSANIDSTNQITSVTCPTTTFCAAVDNMGNYLYFNGTTWSAPASLGSSESLTSISCQSSSFCVAADVKGDEFYSTSPSLGAASFSLLSSLDATNEINSVTCPTTSLCLASDNQGNVISSAYASSQWLSLIDGSGSPEISSFSEFNANGQLTATCSNDPLDSPGVCVSDRSDPNATYQESFYDPSGSVYCSLSELEIDAGGTCGAWNPSWLTSPPDNYPAEFVKANMTIDDAAGNSVISIVPDTNVTNTLGDVTETAYSPDGNVFCSVDAKNFNNGTRSTCPVWSNTFDQVRASLSISNPISMSCPVTSVCYMIADDIYGHTLILSTKNANSVSPTWSDEALPALSPSLEALSSISCTSSSTCWAAGKASDGSGVVIVTGDAGKTWSFQGPALPLGTGNLSSISCLSLTSYYCFATGKDSSSNAIVIEYDSSAGTWSTIDKDATDNLSSISCVNSTNIYCYIVATTSLNAPEVVQYDSNGPTWTTYTAPSPFASFSSISCVSSSDCYVTGLPTSGGSNTVTQLNNGTFSSFSPSSISSLSAISCLNSTYDYCFADGISSSGSVKIVSYDSESGSSCNSWCENNPPSQTTSLSAISCPSTTECLTSGNSSFFGSTVAESTDGSTWKASGPISGTSSTYTDLDGHTLESVDQIGDITANQYYFQGLLSATINPDGSNTTYCYYFETAGCSIAPAPSQGKGSGSMLYATVTPANTGEANGLLTTYQYDPGGLTNQESTAAATTSYTYDAMGDLESTLYSFIGSGYTTPSNVYDEYNVDGSKASMLDGTGYTTYTYDQSGNLENKCFTAADSQSSSCGGNPPTNYCTDSCTSSLGSYSMGYTYYPDGQTEKITYPQYSGVSYTTVPSATYTYNDLGEIASVSDNLGNTTNFTYDSDGNVLTQGSANGNSLDTFSYDLADRIIGSQIVSLGSASSGIKPAMPTGSNTVTSTATLLPSKKTSPLISSSSLKSMSSPTLSPSNTSYSSNCASNKEIITFDTGESLGTRDQNGNLTKENLENCNNNSVYVNNTYYLNYNSGSELSYQGTSPQNSSPNTYCYDNARNLTLNNTTVNQVNQASELTGASQEGSGTTPCSNLVNGTSSAAYTYDSLGDRTYATVSGYNFSYGYDALGRMTSYGLYGYGYNYFFYSGDSLEVAGIHLGSPNIQLTWDTRSNLPQILFDSTDAYIYGPLGVPVEQVNMTEAQSNAGSGSDNPTLLYYSPTTTLTAFVVVNTAGYLDNGIIYDAYGNRLLGFSGTVFGYEGQYLGNGSNGSGFYYMRARYYEPATGQFTSMDPAYLSTDQAYSYSNGDPVNSWDPTGLTCQDVEQAVVLANDQHIQMDDAARRALQMTCQHHSEVQYLIQGNNESASSSQGSNIPIVRGWDSMPTWAKVGDVSLVALPAAALVCVAGGCEAVAAVLPAGATAEEEDPQAGNQARGFLSRVCNWLSGGGNGYNPSDDPAFATQDPENLYQQMALKAAQSGQGTQIMGQISDPRLGPNWVKMQYVLRGQNGALAVVHYFLNTASGQMLGFKFIK